MRRPNESGATADGRFKETPAPATKLSAGFLNILTDEICNVVTNPDGGNMALNAADNGQLLKAILAMLERSLPVAFAPGELSVNIGGLIIKAGSVRGSLSEGVYWTPFPTPFPNHCWHATHIPMNYGGPVNRDLMPQLGGDSTVNGFYARMNLGGGTTTNSIDGYDWFAFGT